MKLISLSLLDGNSAVLLLQTCHDNEYAVLYITFRARSITHHDIDALLRSIELSEPSPLRYDVLEHIEHDLLSDAFTDMRAIVMRELENLSALHRVECDA